MNKIYIRPPMIRLKDALQLADIAGSGGQAKLLIAAQEIKVNGEKCTVFGKQLHEGDVITFDGTDFFIEYEN